MSTVRESCRCGASIEFDDAEPTIEATSERLAVFRRDHRCAPETAGAGEAPTRAGFTEDTPPAPAPDLRTVEGFPGELVDQFAERVVHLPRSLRPFVAVFNDHRITVTKESTAQDVLREWERLNRGAS